MQGCAYQERMARLSHFSPEKRRLKGDLAFLIMKDFDRVVTERMLPLLWKSITRGHQYKMVTTKFNWDLRKKYLFPSKSNKNVEAATQRMQLK